MVSFGAVEEGSQIVAGLGNDASPDSNTGKRIERDSEDQQKRPSQGDAMLVSFMEGGRAA